MALKRSGCRSGEGEGGGGAAQKLKNVKGKSEAKLKILEGWDVCVGGGGVQL